MIEQTWLHTEKAGHGTQERLRNTVDEIHGRSNVAVEGLLSRLNWSNLTVTSTLHLLSRALIINRVDFWPIDKAKRRLDDFVLLRSNE